MEANMKREDALGSSSMSDGINTEQYSAAASFSTLIDDDGFERVLTPAERKALRKKANVAAQTNVVSMNGDVKSGTRVLDSVFNKIKSRMQKFGVDVASLPITSDMSISCDAAVEDLNELIDEIDAAIKSAPGTVPTPLRFTNLDDLDKTVREINDNLRRLKAKSGKGLVPDIDDIESAIKDNETYLVYLKEERVIVEGYQRMKTFQNKLQGYKKALLDIISYRAASARRSSLMTDKGLNPASARSQQNDYILGILQRMKADKGLVFDHSNVIKSELVLMATPNRFHPPYNYLKRIKERFFVHIDPIDVKGSDITALHLNVHGESADVDACVTYLKSLEFHSSKQIHIDYERIKKIFGGLSGLSQIDESFNVMTFYYQGAIDLIGSRDGVNLAFNYIDEKIKAFESNVDVGKSISAPATLAEHEARKVQLQYDFLVCKALSMRFRNLVRNIEADLGVSVSFDFTARDGKAAMYVNVDSTYKTDDQSATGRIKTAVTQLEALAASMGTVEIPGTNDEDVMSYLFSEDILRCRFVSPDFCMHRYGGMVHIVGKKSVLKDALVRVKTLLLNRNMKPRELHVEADMAFMLSPSTLSAVEDWTGVTILIRESINGSVLVIYGNKEQQDECVKQVEEILSTHVEYTFDLSSAHMAVLSDNKYRIIRDLEDKTHVHIVVKKVSNELIFHGQREKVDEAVDVMKAFTENFVCLDNTKISDITITGDFYAWIRVPKRHIGAVIGKGGSTLRDIISNAGLRNIFVNRGDNSDDIVCFEGNKVAVKNALEVLSHILEFDGVNQQDSPIEDFLVGRYSSTHSVLRTNVPTTVERSSKPARNSGSKPIVFDCRDDDFPALGSKM
ncbi:KH domain family protein [Babesia bovis T2Bo]|uniref:K Homology domain-containing protein n=1 Tax=Babesia bovis TaxID=5865 RepID=A7ART8_BABBO|nr:KH domain family protein [Babesia bovis T2Bo]EDO07257.1 KH domain family protein [Babesia bovis T2Bo]|eukprot:XP_001610825.1 hypothetical protein [Babesia bovis T2Bo]